MSHRRTRRTGTAFGQSLRRGVVLIAGVILIGLVSSALSASATPLREVADTVGSTVRSIHAPANTAPSLPSLPPSATPPATPTTPAAPQVPPGQLPTEPTAPTPSPSQTGSGGDVPSVDGIAGAARNSVGSVTSTRGETAKQAPASAGSSDGGRASVPQSGPAGAGKAAPRAIGTASSAPPSVSDAEVAALQRWFARVWPAIALGGGEAGRDWVVRLIEEDLFRPAVVAFARLLSLVPPVIRAAAIQAAGDSPLVRDPAGTANEKPQIALPDIPAPVNDEKTLYFIAFAALLASLVFMLREEFRSTFRAGVRRWHRLRSR
jgi:hypothetical protein